MSIDKRYDAFLSDLLILFQQITIRYIKEKPIDIQKFKHYFNMFYDRMAHLEISFHQSKLHITKLLTRLRQTLSPVQEQNRQKVEIMMSTNKKKDNRQQFAHSFIRSVSSKKRTDFSKELGSIVEEDEHYVNKIDNKRSQTVAGYHSNSNSDNRIQVRPKTGHIDPKRYSNTNNMQSMNKTISIRVQNRQLSEAKYVSYSGFTLDSNQILNNRKLFYEQLQKKQIQSNILGREQVKWIYGRKKSRSGWGKRISRLF